MGLRKWLLLATLLALTVVSLIGTTVIFAANTASKVNLTYWWWGESDAPGADKWVRETADLYHKQHPNVTINIVPQSTDTLIAAFKTAAQAKSGPDLASQWATIPTLSQAWAKAIVPISDYIPKSELKHWVNLDENLYAGKFWGGSLYLMGTPLVYNKSLFKKAGLDPEKAPKTWNEFLQDCAKLKAAGITPIGAGNKGSSYFGAWMFSMLGVQYLDSPSDIIKAVIGDASFSDPKHSEWLNKFNELYEKGYFNDDISSLEAGQGMDLFSSGKVAFIWATDGNVLQFAKDLGPETIGLTKTPVLGNGKLKDTYTTTQSTSQVITSWCSNKKVAADFLVFMHTPERMKAWYLGTNTFPADDRFDKNLITDPIMKQLLILNTSYKNIWLENYIPTQLDMNGYRSVGQLIVSGSGKPNDAVALLERNIKLWRLQKQDELAQFKLWSKSK